MMFNFVFGMLFGAIPPEINSRLLFGGPGPTHTFIAADAYNATYNALVAAAEGTDASMKAMSASYRSPASAQAQQAFANSTSWMRAQAEVALRASYKFSLAAAANQAARDTMPNADIAEKTREAAIALTLTNHMGVNNLQIAALETLYAAMWFAAARSMSTYAGEALDAVFTVPTPLPGPPVAAGAAPGPSADAIATALNNLVGGLNSVGGGANSAPGTAAPAASGPADTGPVGGTGGENPGGGGTGGQSPGGSGGDGMPGASDPGAGQATSAPDPMSTPEALGDGGGPAADPVVPQDAGFYGVSPTSPTLSGLGGGTGSAVMLGMSQGGVGAMSGAANGFKMPSNWNPLSVRAFGAGTGGPAVEQPVPQRVAPRGVSAPQTQRRRERDERRPSKATAVADQGSVPELEHDTGIGVIGYSDADDQPLTASEQLLVSGVLHAGDHDE